MQVLHRSSMRFALVLVRSFRKPALERVEVEGVELDGI